MNININADFNKALEVIGNGLSDTAAKSFKFIYPLAVKDVFIGSLIGVITGFLVMVFAVWALIKLSKKCKNFSNDEPWFFIIAFLAAAAALIGFCVFLGNLPMLLNPQYYAIQNIIRMVKP